MTSRKAGPCHSSSAQFCPKYWITWLKFEKSISVAEAQSLEPMTSRKAGPCPTCSAQFCQKYWIKFEKSISVAEAQSLEIWLKFENFISVAEAQNLGLKFYILLQILSVQNRNYMFLVNKTLPM